MTGPRNGHSNEFHVAARSLSQCKKLARLAAATAMVLLTTAMPGASGQAASLPPYPGADLHEDCRYQWRAEQRLHIGNAAETSAGPGAVDAAEVSGSFTATAGCLDGGAIETPAEVLELIIPQVISDIMRLFGRASARRTELADACSLLAPIAAWVELGDTQGLQAVVGDVLRRLARNGTFCDCASGFTATEQTQFAEMLLPMECHIADRGGLPTALLSCPHLREAAADLGLHCSHAAAEREGTHLFMIHLETAARLTLHQCGSPARVTMQLYTDWRNRSSGVDVATAPWQPRYGFDDYAIRSTVPACVEEAATAGNASRGRPVLVSEWLEAGAHALLISRGDSDANNVSYTVGINVFDDERRLLASTALNARTDIAMMSGLGDRTAEKWAGIVHSPVTGLLYAAPHNADSVLIIDPARNSADATTIAGFGYRAEKWAGIVHSPVSGLLYAAPHNADCVLIIDPTRNTADTTTIPGLGRLGYGTEKWFGIVHSPVSGLLYAAPHNADSVLIIDPARNTADATTIAGFSSGGAKWSGIVHSPMTGLLYAAPHNADSVLIIDPACNTADTTTIAGLSSGGAKWYGIVHSPMTGLLYAAPHNADSVLIIDPARNTSDTTTIAGLGSDVWKWSGIVHSPVTGHLYAAPHSADSVLIIDPANNTADTTTMSGLRGPLRYDSWIWAGIVHSPVSGLLYAAPSDADGVLVVYPNTSAVATDFDGCTLDSQCAATCLVAGCGWNDTQGLCRTSEEPTSVAAIQRGAGRHNGESCPAFRLSGSCADEIQYQFDQFLASAYFVLGESKTIPGPDWTGPACGPQTTATTSAFLSPTNRDYSAIRLDSFELTRDDGTAPESRMLSFSDPISSKMSVSNTVPGKYIGRWIATDGGVMGDEPHPQRTVVATLPFEVRAYDVAPKQRCRSQLDTIVQNLSSSVYYVGDYLGIDGLSPDCTVAGGGFTGVSDPAAATFQLRVTPADGGPAFDGPKLIDASTGQMLLRPGLMSAGVEYHAELQVRDGARSAPFARWTIKPRRHVDLTVVANGPNGRDCVRGARVDTGDQHDAQYTCDCTGTDFTGDNCDVSPASELAMILGAGLGAVFCSSMIALVATWLQLYQFKHRPVDMGAVQGDVVAGLSVGAAKDILDHEFGIVLELDVGPAEDGQADVGACRAQLVSVVAKHVPRLARELAQARISTELGPNRLVLIIPKPAATLGNTSAADVPERTVAGAETANWPAGRPAAGGNRLGGVCQSRNAPASAP